MWIVGGIIGWAVVVAYVVGALAKAGRPYPTKLAPVIPIRKGHRSDAS